jgi:hypothetical protein
MNTGMLLQMLGATCELLGLLLVAWGISATRSRFTDRQSMPRRAWAAAQGFAARFTRRHHVVIGGATVSAIASVGGRARVTIGFGPWDELSIEDRLSRLRSAIERHEEVFGHLDDRLDWEGFERREADDAQSQARLELDGQLRQEIRDAAAGGLRRETWGALLFALGIVLGTLGNLIS